MSLCRHANSKRAGIVTNQTGPLDLSRPHMGATTCYRLRCIEDTYDAVVVFTRELDQTVFVPDNTPLGRQAAAAAEGIVPMGKWDR